MTAYMAIDIFGQVNIKPVQLFATLSHDTRLRCLLLLLVHEELCVCELTQAIGAAQPHMSRHLAQLRETGLVSDRRDGLWIHYRINPLLPAWVVALLQQTARAVAGSQPYDGDLATLSRPSNQQSQPRCA